MKENPLHTTLDFFEPANITLNLAILSLPFVHATLKYPRSTTHYGVGSLQKWL